MSDTPGQPADPDKLEEGKPSSPSSGQPQDAPAERGSLWESNAPVDPSRAPEKPVGALFNQMLGRDAGQAQPLTPTPARNDPPAPAKPVVTAPREPAQTKSASKLDARPATQPMPAPPGVKPIVRLVNVSKSFGSLHVLRNLTLDIYPGQTTVILGPSGTGKSVLLKHITGLLRPDSGEVWFHDQRIDQLSEKKLVAVRKRMGFLFQMGALFDSMTVGDNVMFPLTEHNRKMSLREKCERCQTMLKIVGLGGIEKKMPGDLSGGQKKRVALARAIVLEPELVLYDEPTTGLDPIRSDVINELILGLTRELGIASIVVTHDMVSANKIADRMIMLYDGQIVIDGTPDTVNHSDHDMVCRFIHGQADQDELDAIRQGIAPVARH